MELLRKITPYIGSMNPLPSPKVMWRTKLYLIVFHTRWDPNFLSLSQVMWSKLFGTFPYMRNATISQGNTWNLKRCPIREGTSLFQSMTNGLHSVVNSTTGFLSQGRAKLGAFPHYCFTEKVQLSPSLTRKPGIWFQCTKKGPQQCGITLEKLKTHLKWGGKKTITSTTVPEGIAFPCLLEINRA